jgi:hypothetical protein
MSDLARQPDKNVSRKHFCPIRAENLTRPHTSGGLWSSQIARKIGILAVGWCGSARRPVLSHCRYQLVPLKMCEQVLSQTTMLIDESRGHHDPRPADARITRLAVKSGAIQSPLRIWVSLDSGNALGPLQSAETLRQSLCMLKNTKPNTALQRVFELLDPEEVTRHVIDAYRDCIPGATVKAATKFLWRRIFSFNIDDALEAAYRTKGQLQE